jgi:ribosome recycling factor
MAEEYSELTQLALEDAQERDGKTIEALRREFATVRTGRANASLLDHIRADYYGVPTPISQMATISVPEARLLVIQPWDRGSIGEIERAIQKSDIGITPNSDGTLIRLAIQMLSEQRRKDLVKQVHRMAEEARVALRNIRRDAIEELRKGMRAHEISEDEERRAQELLQKRTDESSHIIERLTKEKEHELMEV